MVKNLQCRKPGFDPLEKGMAADSSILAWRILWSEESGALQSMGSKRVGHDGERLILSLSSYLKKAGNST